ncbi:12073_t:CDS:1, partial [Dentiscutata heterogama]
MFKRPRQVAISILKKGFLVEELHYGPYLCYWWELYTNIDDPFYFFIRLGFKIKVNLNNQFFYLTIQRGNEANFFPEYCCESGGYHTISSNLTNAISTIYKHVFDNQIRYSGSVILGWNQKEIVQQLISDVLLFPVSCMVGKYKLFVYGVGNSSHNDWYNTEIG